MNTSGPHTVNDIHSRLNETSMDTVLTPHSIEDVRQSVNAVRDAGRSLSIAGGRHAMGGQQFLTGGTLMDTRELNRVLDLDRQRGLVKAEAGIMWSDLITCLRSLQQEGGTRWSIVQKQTGADRLSVGGALAANGHGRGLTYQPIVQDVESLELIDPDGQLLTCSRTENPDLFSLAIGGYGLIGVISTVTLRLMPAHYVRRVVEITTVDQVPDLFENRIAEGFTYGDFQYRTDERSPGFLRDGVLSCYEPVADAMPPDANDGLQLLTEADWRMLLYLSHADKARAFDEYAGFYSKTDGQVYDSDTFQLSLYIDDYHRDLDHQLHQTVGGTETIAELYVPLPSLPDFMAAAAAELKSRDANVIYGTIRLIERDDDTFLSWARQRYACIVVNLHVEHSASGIEKATNAMRSLIDQAAARDGSYFLTYGRFATAEQLHACHPRFEEFLSEKRRLDPQGVFSSDWYRAYGKQL